MRIALTLLSLAVPMQAAAHEIFFGTWGTDKQCARAPILSGGTRLAEPFEINSDWLRQGDIWCQLTWFPLEARKDNYFSGAFARCGEDAVRDYFLRMTLDEDRLALSWALGAQSSIVHRCG